MSYRTKPLFLTWTELVIALLAFGTITGMLGYFLGHKQGSKGLQTPRTLVLLGLDAARRNR